MRWLLIPHVGLQDLEADSNFILFCDLARTLAAAGDFVYLTGPWQALPAAVALPPRCLYCPVPADFDYYTTMLGIDHEWLVRTFSRRWSTDLVDAVVTSKIAFIPYLQALLSDSLRCHDLPVYGFEPAVQDEGFGTTFKGRSVVTLRAWG